MYELKKEKKTGQMAKMVVGLLNKMIMLDANSTSCIVVYQPKAPEKLKQFRNNKLK